MELYLLEKLVNERVKRSNELIMRICKRYLRGIGIDYDTRVALHNDALQAIDDILQPFGLYIVIDKNNYQLLLDDYNCWSNGVSLTNEHNGEWLFYNKCNDKSIDKRTDEKSEIAAPLYAKEQFFRVLTEYRIPIEYYKPRPEDIPNPHAKCIHSYADGHRFLIRFECVNNNSFFADQNLTGKYYILNNEYGLKANITIDRVYEAGDKIPFRNYFIEKTPGVMAATGTLEGYTTGEKHSLEIEKIGSHAIWIEFIMGLDDVEVYLNYPLWKKHFEWNQQKIDILADCRFKHFEEIYKKEYEKYKKNGCKLSSNSS